MTSARFTINIAGLTKAYGERTVLDVDSLTLESGHSYALVGPNGSGKSTLIKVLSGVEPMTAGRVDVGGSATREDLAVGYMPQRSYAFGFSVFRNVAMALHDSGKPRDEINRRVREALEAVGMADMADSRGSGLSGGEAQRVALARMLVQDLDVLLLDEPTASMDIAGTTLVEGALAAYRRRTGCLMLTATHAPSQARRISDRAVMLAEGRIVEFGDTATALSYPTSKAGQEFLSYWAV
ncbi:Methionine import ATP-binding protein MetN [Slackia heliotrinireducens]|uniref:ATPase component of Mn/Zn ABC-type transporter n=1 Tax=Slackia heliotrinireducens (strain ATCC 29202 / DSM 20476 / NCTC 11029 / RHS 1) TaxID=471855 RepID=C7N3J1_SLAHD|nr:ATP-binding cassette domain-containing protein [Slackia heliotrinireducens]ACV23714.1 ATPase component of Mn/Zn ABC-type transporter [Slackia heliotrinireducens DSM 20476]VEH03295.1 Methionine import ATP-binding protein MetN [Slackia heliotrinireducens]